MFTRLVCHCPPDVFSVALVLEGSVVHGGAGLVLLCLALVLIHLHSTVRGCTGETTEWLQFPSWRNTSSQCVTGRTVLPPLRGGSCWQWLGDTAQTSSNSPSAALGSPCPPEWCRRPWSSVRCTSQCR